MTTRYRPSWSGLIYLTNDPKVAALTGSIVRNHALVNSDRRLGWLAVIAFHGWKVAILDAPDEAHPWWQGLLSGHSVTGNIGDIPLEVKV